MRRLYLVPIVHMSADMGSLAPALDRGAEAWLGLQKWKQHKEVVRLFWDSIANFFEPMDVAGFKIYQDGLVAGGEEGLKIVNEGARSGSRNFAIIAGLLARGAILVPTEDISLVRAEYELVEGIARAATFRQKEIAALHYRLNRARLLEKRDMFIADKIGETLKPDETGILFIGAEHEIIPRLDRDVEIVQVREVTKVRDYHRALARGIEESDRQRLAKYLATGLS